MAMELNSLIHDTVRYVKVLMYSHLTSNALV